MRPKSLIVPTWSMQEYGLASKYIKKHHPKGFAYTNYPEIDPVFLSLNDVKMLVDCIKPLVNVDASTIFAQILNESDGCVNCYNWSQNTGIFGAVGLMQPLYDKNRYVTSLLSDLPILSIDCRKYSDNKDYRRVPALNVIMGALFLEDLFKRSRSEEWVIKSYFVGPNGNKQSKAANRYYERFLQKKGLYYENSD